MVPFDVLLHLTQGGRLIQVRRANERPMPGLFSFTVLGLLVAVDRRIVAASGSTVAA